MPFYTIKESDVGKSRIKAFGRTWLVEDFLGQVLKQDVGKRVFRRGDHLMVENNQQRDARLARTSIGRRSRRGSMGTR